MRLFNLNDLKLVLFFLLAELLLVVVFEGVGCLLAVDELDFNFLEVLLELVEQLPDGLLVLIFDGLNLFVKLLFHLKPLLLELQKRVSLPLKLLLKQLLDLLDLFILNLLDFHLCFHVLRLLLFLLKLKILVALLEVLDVCFFLRLDLHELDVVALTTLGQFRLDLALCALQVVC